VASENSFLGCERGTNRSSRCDLDLLQWRRRDSFGRHDFAAYKAARGRPLSTVGERISPSVWTCPRNAWRNRKPLADSVAKNGFLRVVQGDGFSTTCPQPSARDRVHRNGIPDASIGSTEVMAFARAEKLAGETAAASRSVFYASGYPDELFLDAFVGG